MAKFLHDPKYATVIQYGGLPETRRTSLGLQLASPVYGNPIFPRVEAGSVMQDFCPSKL